MQPTVAPSEVLWNQKNVALHFSGRVHHDQVEQIQQFLAGLDANNHEQRCRAYASLAAVYTTSPQAAIAAAQHATREAELAGSATARVWAQFARCVSNLTPELAQRRANDAAEILSLETNSDTEMLVTTSYFMLLGALTELARIPELDRVLDPGGELLRRHSQLDGSRHAAWFRCVRATLDGRAEAAEAFAAEGYRLAELAKDPDGLSVKIGQLAVIRWMEGRVGELEPMLLQARQLLPDDIIWSATLAWVWLSQGRVSAARGLVRMLPALDKVPRDRNWLAAMSILAVVVAQLKEHELAQQLLEMLGGFSDRLASIGLGVTVWGTVARPLGLLHLMLGDVPAAVSYYREAIRVCTTAGAHAWLAEAQFELAQLFFSQTEFSAFSATQSSTAEIENLLREARATAHALQLHEIEQACATLESRLRGGKDTSHTTSHADRAEPAPFIQVFGDFVVTSLEGENSHWQSRKARELLKILVASRGAPVHKETVMDLLWPGVHPDQLGNRLAVALVTVRRALDPAQRMHRNTFISATSDSIRLCLDRCIVDIEEWFVAVDRAFAANEAEQLSLFADVLEQARQPVFADEIDSTWAEKLRREARSRAFAAAYELADAALRLNEPLRTAEAYHWILELDPYDQRAHQGLIDTFVEMGAHGHAGRAQQEYESRMAELGLNIVL